MNTIQAFLGSVWGRIMDEPVMSLAVVQAALALAVGFGAKLSGDQVALVVAFTAAVLGLIARQKVTPVP